VVIYQYKVISVVVKVKIYNYKVVKVNFMMKNVGPKKLQSLVMELKVKDLQRTIIIHKNCVDGKL